jgi:hypothetical protein
MVLVDIRLAVIATIRRSHGDVVGVACKLDLLRSSSTIPTHKEDGCVTSANPIRFLNALHCHSIIAKKSNSTSRAVTK